MYLPSSLPLFETAIIAILFIYCYYFVFTLWGLFFVSLLELVLHRRGKLSHMNFPGPDGVSSCQLSEAGVEVEGKAGKGSPWTQ